MVFGLLDENFAFAAMRSKEKTEEIFSPSSLSPSCLLSRSSYFCATMNKKRLLHRNKQIGQIVL